jgi:hypothetical protein
MKNSKDLKFYGTRQANANVVPGLRDPLRNGQDVALTVSHVVEIEAMLNVEHG